jgi:hypothetical protein
MKILMIFALSLIALAALAEDCVTLATGRKVCKPVAAAGPTTNQVTAVQTNTVTNAAYNPNTGTAATSEKYANAHSRNWIIARR